MTVMVTGDLHWNDKSIDSYRHDFVRTMVRLIIKYDVEVFIILGDLTEEKDHHGAWLVNTIFSHIYRLAVNCDVYILRGNHDSLVTSIPFFRPLGRLERVTWINKPKVIRGLPLPSKEILFLPHTRDHERDWSGIDFHKFQYVFTHNTFAGARAENGVKLEGIPHSLFSRKQNVISGDIHVPQQLGPVTYVGAPYPIRFGDDFSPRILMFNDDGGTRSFSYKGPRKCVIDLTPTDTPKLFRGMRSGDILKIRLHMSAGDAGGTFRNCKERIVKYYRKKGCVVHLVQPIAAQVTKKSSKKTRKLGQRSDRELMKAYATATGVGDKVLNTGLRLLKKYEATF